ncbi:MFS transporter [Pendulispora albinea]|uniref:MFS transporter n=1 Tax=Pendulispora albinea TaxID=2741071 RepID=A0ABZ2M567_9BACT
MPSWVTELAPIAILLAVIGVVSLRLPRVDLAGEGGAHAGLRHSPAFVRRRFLNWFPVGLTYAFLYMGRYNLTVCKNALGQVMSKEDFGTIFSIGTVVYGFAFVLNGPLTDKWGGRRTILLSAVGAALANLGMGWVLLSGRRHDLPGVFAPLYALNMYFQSFGAVSIVKVNAAWFHVRERGTFGGVFGILISLGIYFAYDWGQFIVDHAELHWVFFVPALLLLACAVFDAAWVRDTPGQAGHLDFDTADSSSGDTGPALTVFEVGRRMLRHPVIMTIALVEFCSGYLRNAIMQWYPIMAKETGIAKTFIPAHWGMMTCIAGILGGVFAGLISDRIFHSRRGPVSAVLYGAMLAGTAAMFAALATPLLGWLVVFLSLCIIGVHGMLSGTASMDFGGKKNVGVAVGLIDGFVYLGTAVQAYVLGRVLPKGQDARSPETWWQWPLVMVPAALAGFLLATRVWNAKPKPREFAAQDG